MKVIIDNENKKLSRNRKKRIERKSKINDNMKSLLNKIKTEKKNFDKINQLEIEIVKIKYANNPNKLQSELKELNKIQVIDKNLHEIKQEILQEYEGDFEMVGNLKIGDQIRQTKIRFRNISDYEAYINAIDQDYDSEDALFNGYIYKLDTPQFNKVNRSQYGNGCSFDKLIVEYRGNNCFIPTKGYCFVKCINYLTGQDYKEQYLDFIRNEKRRSNIMTKARIQPFCRANNINLGYWDGERVFPRCVTNRDSALFLFNNHFCLIWKSQGKSFRDAIKEVIENFKVVDNYITEENVNSHFKYEFTPKKIESHLTNFIVYDLETHNTDRAKPYNMTFYRLSKIAGRYERDPTPEELEKSKKDTIAFMGDDCINNALDYCLKLKGEERKTINNKIVENNLQMHAHNGSGFDTWLILNNLRCDKHIVGDIIKNGKGIISMKIFNGYIYNGKKQIPQYLIFRCGIIHLNYSLKKLGKTFELPKELLKTEMNHDEITADNYKDKKDIWLPYVKNDVLCTAYSYARYIKDMEEITGFSMKDCLSLPGLGWKYFNSLRTEEDEPIYTYNDKYMRWFVRRSIKGGRVGAFNQYYKPKHCDDILKIINKELAVKGTVYDTIEAYMEYKSKHFKIFEKEYEDRFDDYRDENVEEKEKYINEKLSELRLHKIIKRIELIHLLWDYDAVSLYPSAMWDEKSIYPRVETGYAYTRDMNDELVEKFNTRNFNQGSAILKIKYYNPKNLIVQHIPIKEKEKKIEINRMRNGYIVDYLTSVDIREIVKIGGKVIEIYEGVIYRENFKVSPFRKVIDKLFALRQKYKDENNDVMQLSVKLLMNSLYGENIRKDIEEKFACKSEMWMQTEYDERVKDYWKISGINYIVKMIDDAGLEDEVKKLNTMPLHLGAFVLSNGKRIMNNFIHAIDGFYTNDVYYTDTDSLYIENKHWEKLEKAGLVGKNLLQGKNDYKDGGIFYGLFLAPKIKYCLTVNKYGVIGEHKTFKGFTNVSDNLDRKEYFKMADGDKLVAKVPLSWKKSFSQGVVIPHKMRNCSNCTTDILCDDCDKLVNQRKEFSANLNELKREKPNDFGHMLPKYIIS